MSIVVGSRESGVGGRRSDSGETESALRPPTPDPRLPIHRLALVLVLFAAARVLLLVFRAPFFDELFTRWIAGKSFAGILEALRHDSGPPLYYFFVHLLGDPSVAASRVLSLTCAAISLFLILRASRRRPASPMILAATLLAVFPPAVLFAADARAYAMCAMFITIAVLAVDDDRPYIAALALVAAAYSHYYGALLFPILLLSNRSAGGPPAGPPPARRRLQALALAAILYIPALWLASHQPPEARAWMASSWPDALFVRPPIALAIVGVAAFAVSLRVNRYMVMVLVPFALALVLRVYVPMRFEAIVATPLILWLAESLRTQRFRAATTTALVGVGIAWTALGIVDHARRPPDPYREVAQWVSNNVPANQPVIASGYCYLETLMNGHEQVTAFPPEQAEHPGWRALPRPGLRAPQGVFLWVGERYAPELRIFAGEQRRVEPLFMNDRAMAARVR